jgi:flavodoxin
MYNVLILWAPDSAETRKAAESVRAAFNEGRFKTILKKADESSIVDVAAADVVIFGLQKSGSAEVPPEFSDLLRVFKGVTLAGRAAGVFSVGSEKASAKMKKSLKDTEVSLFEEDPLFSNDKPDKASEVSDWARKLAGFFQEVRSARE